MKKPEEAEMNAIDPLMAAIGFLVVRFSQPRASMQTEGWVDRLYLAPDGDSLFWEAKAPGRDGERHQGRSLAQVRMAKALVAAFNIGWLYSEDGEAYAGYRVGDRDVVVRWLETEGWVAPGTMGAVVLRRIRWPE